MKFHSFDKLTGAYLDSGDAHESPEEPGTFHCPAWATFKEPPVTADGLHSFWDGEDWIVLPGSPEVAMLTAIGLLSTPQEKAELVQAAVNQYLELACKALGFRDLVDAMTYPPGNLKLQKQLDAKGLREWRALVDVSAEALSDELAVSTGIMPGPNEILMKLPSFVRTFPQAFEPVPPATEASGD